MSFKTEGHIVSKQCHTSALKIRGGVSPSVEGQVASQTPSQVLVPFFPTGVESDDNV